MTADGTVLLFEGFLKKRKDTMKMRWATYWFRLQNTTLFFYTKKECSASHLRGLYYIYTVQSVREVERENYKHFVFEITMTNGKRKMLAAETAPLRKEWIDNLWRSMYLSSSQGLDPGSRDQDVCEHKQQDRLHSSTNSYSDCDSVTGSLDGRPLSAPAHPALSHHEDRSTLHSCSEELNTEDATHQNILPDCEKINAAHWCVEESQEDDYDVLPPRNTIYQSNQSSEKDSVQDNDLYDVPPSNRTAADHQEHREMTESIYDVPSSLLRKMSDHALEDQLEGGSLLEDMMANLEGQPAGWGIPADTSEGTYMPMYL